MKLHLPKLLRNSVLACITAVAGIATTTVGTATFVGGVAAFSLTVPQAAAATYKVTTGSDSFLHSCTFTDEADNETTVGWATAAKGDANSNTLHFVAGTGNDVSLEIQYNDFVVGALQVDADTNVSGLSPSGTRAFYIGVTGSEFTSTFDRDFSIAPNNGLYIRGAHTWTVASGKTLSLTGLNTATDGSSLVITGAVTLNGTVKLGSTLDVTGSVSLASDVVFDLSGMTEADGVYTLFSNNATADLSSLTLSNITGVITIGKSWTFGTNGTISYTVTSRDLTWEGGDLNWSATGTNFTTGGEFTTGDNVNFTGDANVTVAQDGVTVYSMSITGEGTEVVLTTKNPIISATGITIGDGASLALNAQSDSVGVLRGTVTVENGGTLVFNAKDVTGYSGGANSTQVINVNAGGTLLLSIGGNNETFAGTLNLDGSLLDDATQNGVARWDLYGGNAKIVVGSDKNALVTANLQLRQNDSVLEVGSGSTLSLNGAVSKGNEGNGVLIKSGAGTLILNGSNTFGGLTSNAGTIQINSGVTLSGNMTVGSGSIVIGGKDTTSTVGTVTMVNAAPNASLNLTAGNTLNASYVNFNWNRSITIDGVLNVTGDDGMRVGIGSNSMRLQGKGTISTTKLNIQNYATFNPGSVSMVIGSGGINVDADCTLATPVTLTSTGSVTLNGTINVLGTGSLTTAGAGTYSEADNNGFYTGDFYVIQTEDESTLTTGDSFALKLNGTAYDKFSITDNNLLVQSEGSGTYFINKGPVSATDTVMGTDGFAGYYVAEGQTLNITEGADLTADNAWAALIGATGPGSVVLGSSVTLTGQAATQSAGKLVIGEGAILTLGSGDGNTVSVASYSGIEIDGGQITFNNKRDTFCNVTVTAKGGTFRNYDHGNGDGVVSTFAGTTTLNGNLTMTAEYNGQYAFEKVVGKGNLSITRGSEALKISLGDLSDYEGTITATNVMITLAANSTRSTGTITMQGTPFTVSSGVSEVGIGLDLHGMSAVVNSESVKFSGDVKLTNTSLAGLELSGTNCSSVDFTGKMSGGGNFIVAVTPESTTTISGDVSGWTAGNVRMTNSGTLVFTGDATDIKVGLIRADDNGNLKLKFDNTAAVTTSSRLGNGQGTMSLELTAGTRVTSTNDQGITVNSLTLGNGSSLILNNQTISLDSGKTLVTTGASTLGSALMLNGGAITLGGALNLNSGALNFDTANKSTLTLAEGMVTEDATVVNLFTGVSALAGVTLTNDSVLGDLFIVDDSELASVSVRLLEGHLQLVYGGLIPENALYVPTEGLVYDDAEVTDVMDTILLGGGTLSIGDTAIDSDLTTLNSQGGGSIVGTGSVAELTFSQVNIGAGDTVTIKDGATDLTVKAGALSLGENSKIVVEAGQILDLTAIDYTGENGSFANMVNAMSGAGKVKAAANGNVVLAKDATLSTNLTMSALELNSWKPTNHVLTIADNGSLDITGQLIVESTATLAVTGGDVTAGSIRLGHDNGSTHAGHISMSSGSITTDSISKTTSTGSSITVSGGTLELTGTGGIAEGIATTITGGTLVAKEASWGITGATIGGATVSDDVPHCAVTITTNTTEGEGYSITLTNSTLTGTIDNLGGKLVLAGSSSIQGAGYNKQEELDYFSNGGTDGFATIDTYYQLVTTHGNLTVEKGATFSVGEATATYIADGEKAGWVRVDGTEYGDIYYLNTAGNTTLTDIKKHADEDGYKLTRVALNGGNLEITETDAAINILGMADGTIKLSDANTSDETEVVLKSSQLTVDSGKTVTLTGNGVYDIASANALSSGVQLDSTWEGTVRLTGSSLGGINLDALGNASSTKDSVEFCGVIAHLSQNGTYSTNLILTAGADEAPAWSINNGWAGDVRTFNGAISGNGDIERTAGTGGSQSFIFAGDISGWSGTVKNYTTHQDTKFNITGSTEIKASFDSYGSDNIRYNLQLTIDDATIADSVDDKTVTATGSISVSALTLGSAADTTDTDRATIKLNNSVTAGTLTNYAKTTINGTLADGAAVTNNGTLKLTQDTTTLASLVNNGSINASVTTQDESDSTSTTSYKDLVVNGTISGEGALAAGALTLKGASNTVGDLTLSGALTLGTSNAAATLTADSLNIGGNVVVNNLVERLITAGVAATDSAGAVAGIVSSSSLNLIIGDVQLRDYMQANNTSTITLATIHGMTDDAVKEAFSVNNLGTDTDNRWENYAYTTKDGQYTYSLVVTDGVVTLERSVNGYKWEGIAETADYWSNMKSWSGNPTALGETDSVQFTGLGCAEVIIENNVQSVDENGDKVYDENGNPVYDPFYIKNVTIEVADNAAVKEYSFTAAEGSDWNKIHVGQNLAVNKGTLNIGAAVNVYSEAYTAVREDATLNINQQAFVRAESGITIGGTVTVDGFSAGEGVDSTENDGQLYVINGGNIDIAATGKVTVEGVLSAVKDKGQEYNEYLGDKEYDDFANNATGSDINNAGIVMTEGTIIAEGNLNNTGTLTQTDGKLWVLGTLNNTAAATEENPDAGVTISGGEAVLGALNNAGTMNVSGTNTKVQAGSMVNSGTLDITGGSVTVGAEGATAETTSLTNTGTITVGTDAENTASLTVNGSLSHSGEGDINVMAGSTMDVTGDLSADGMVLGFDGNVTVGGDVKVNELTINEGASFTANGTDADVDITTLTNNGSLAVGKDVDGTLTGGKLHIGTLDGSGSVEVGSEGTLDITTLNGTGNVIVGEGGTLSITNDVTFAGTIDNKGTLVTNETMTLTTQTTTGGTIEAKALVVNTGANGSEFTSITTDSITIDTLTTTPTLTTDAVAAKTDGGKITINLTQLIPDENGAWDSATIIDGGADAYHLLKINSDVDVSELFTLNLDSGVEQDILAAGLKAELWDGKTADDSVSWLTSGVESNVLLNVREQSEQESVWTVGDTESKAGLIVLVDGSLKNDTILDNVRKVEVDGAQEIDLTGDISKVTLNGLTALGDDSVLSIKGDGAADVATMNGEYTGVLGLKGVTADMDLTGATVKAEDNTVVLQGTIKDGMLEVQQSSAAQGDGLVLDNTTLRVVIDKDFATLDAATLAELENSIVDLGDTESDGDIEVGTYNAAGDFIASAGYEKYFDMSTIMVDANGKVVADRNTSFYTDKADASVSANGAAGLAMADAVLVELNPQAAENPGALATVLDMLDTATGTAADELGASLAGAGTAVLGMAVSGDVDRQLQAIRNRTTTMGVDQSVANEDMPYFNAWINAEGDRSELSESGTEGGYELNSWGGTVGFDVDFCPTLTAGMALTAMYGDLDVTGADKASGDIDTYYVTAFARYAPSAWTHTFVGTIGMSDISLNRKVAGQETKGETDALSFGLMYEVGRVFALDEDGSTCLQPVFNVTWKHTTVDAYTEDGGDLALEVDEQTIDTVTFGLGARLQTVVGESMYNRTSILEARVLAKADVGDRSGSADVALAALPGAKASVDSAEMGAFGLEAGAGLTIPVGQDGGSIFMDASVELRSDYTNVNGTVGYRINF